MQEPATIDASLGSMFSAIKFNFFTVIPSSVYLSRAYCNTNNLSGRASSREVAYLGTKLRACIPSHTSAQLSQNKAKGTSIWLVFII